jgi:hypothetical protein
MSKIICDFCGATDTRDNTVIAGILEIRSFTAFSVRMLVFDGLEDIAVNTS